LGAKSPNVATGCDSTTGGEPRPQRADALRNRARVLSAAEAVFAAEGIGAPVDVIAEKAGVGVGTLYRHFPTKEKLYEAILMERIIELTADARCRLSAEDPGKAFFGFIEHMVEQSTLKRDLINALAVAGVEPEAVVGEAKEAMADAIGDLLTRAQDAGAVRRDVTAVVVMSLIGATCVAAIGPYNPPPDDMLAIVFDGLRAIPTPR
jgi:AcrR family transcriptional regulator